MFARVGIFGTGLLGGSVGLGLRERFLAEEVVAYDPDPTALEAALALGAADRIETRLGPWIAELDLGVLAAPVGALEALGREVARHAAPSTLWTDVGSVKAPVVAALEPLLPRFVGGHPMAGSERAGVENAHAGLLQNAAWILTPSRRTAAEDLKQLERLVEALGAYPLLVAPELHDRLVARVSHLPYLLAVALNRIVDADPNRETLMFLAAGGFRDLTRVASGSPRMSRDMVVANRDALREAARDLKAVLDELVAVLDDPERLLELAQEAKRLRDGLPVVRRSLLPVQHDLVVAVPDRPGELARITSALGEAGVNIRDIEVLNVRDEGGAIRLGFTSAEEKRAGRRVLESIGYRTR
ncbi:prephenate dehydrogenase/arogenate dehydrogenase family protein [Oceanithermus desulfurans]